MATIVATCNDIPEFGSDRLADQAWASRFIGVGWATELYPKAAARGWIAASGDVALEKVRSGQWAASDILVVQELGSRQGSDLLKCGARPLLLTCMESPLYAPLFYDRLRTWIDRFPHAMVPGASEDRGTAPGATRLRFPCYWDGEIQPLRSWSGRKDVVLLAGNKYWSDRPKVLFAQPRRTLSALRQQLRLKRSATQKKASSIQLHDAKLACIVILSRTGVLDVYGSGWSDLSRLPGDWRKALMDAGLRAHGKVDDKIALQSNYRFVLCAENARSPGYVTEKIVQCFVSGAIPIYLGAPDIAEFVPREAYVDAMELPSFEDLPSLVLNMEEARANSMLRAGRDFLYGKVARLHSYSGFAEWVLDIAMERLRVHRA